MGCFSWLKADSLTKIANVVEGEVFKMLIPQEFGGGFIHDYYQQYGRIGYKEDGSPKYDMYELLAFWNRDVEIDLENFWRRKELISTGKTVEEHLRYSGEIPKMKEIDENTGFNRSLGIHIACHDEDIRRLKYPLKLVSASFKGTYEDCKGISYSDPRQGMSFLYR